MGNWLFAELGLSPADTVQIPSGQRDDNRRGGEEAVEKGRNRATVEEGYIGAQAWSLEAENDSVTRPVIDRQPTGATLLPSTYDQPTLTSTLQPSQNE